MCLPIQMTAAAMTLYTLLGRPLAKRWSRDTVMAVDMTLGGIVVNLVARSWQFDVSLPAKGWLLVAFIVVFGTVVTFALFLQGIRDAGAVRASILSVTEPVSAAILAFFWLGTAFTTADLLGFAAILATVFLLAKNE